MNVVHLQTSPRATQIWIDQPRLYVSDQQIMTQNIWLRESIIKQKTHAVGSLQDTISLQSGGVTVDGNANVVQCVHNAAKQHWLTVSTIGCPQNTLNVYCSLQMTPSPQRVKAVTAGIKFGGSILSLRIMNVSQQLGGDDCRLFTQPRFVKIR